MFFYILHEPLPKYLVLVFQDHLKRVQTVFFLGFEAKFEGKNSFILRYYCISRVLALNLLSEILLLLGAWETKLFIESYFASARA